MNFFEHQDEARKHTAILVLLFALALVGIVLSTYFALSWALSIGTGKLPVWDLTRFGAVAVGVVVLITLASTFKIASLRGSGSRVAEMLGGRSVTDLTNDPREQMLMNVVAEMAIASGVPVPLVYILDNEPGINAFAAGHGPEDAVVAVTSGALNAFTREELQGVVAHEFSHILNRDVRLNTRLTGLVFGILVIAISGRIILQTMGRGRIRSSNDKGGGGIMVVLAVGAVLMIVGYIGLFFGKLIKQAVSRQREFLADASAVQFTRNPEGLSSALKKIAGWSEGSQLAAPNAEEISHFFFADGLKKSWLSSMLSTHPPLQERIRRLDPSFDVGQLPQQGEFVAPASANDSAQIAALTDHAHVDASPASVMNSIGTTEPERFFYDEALIAELPPQLKTSIASALGAITSIYALLLDKNPTNRGLQLDLLREHVTPQVLSEVKRMIPLVDQLDKFARLPTVDLAMPALRSMTREQFEHFDRTLTVLVQSDNHLTLFEFAVRSIVSHRLSVHFGRKIEVDHRVSKETVRKDATILLSALSRIGEKNEAEANQAFKAGIVRLPIIPDNQQLLRPDASMIELAIDRLSHVPYSTRQAVVDACAHCVLSDDEVEIDEAELLRTVIVALGCPLPPFLPRLA